MFRYWLRKSWRFLACWRRSGGRPPEDAGGKERPVPASRAAKDASNSELGNADKSGHPQGHSSSISTQPGSPSNPSFPDGSDDAKSDNGSPTNDETGSDSDFVAASRVDSKPTLLDALCDAEIEPYDDFRYFIPVDELRRLITPESVALELQRCQVTFPDEASMQKKAVQISTEAPKLFATLVRISKGRYIGRFLDEGIDDTHLPLARLAGSELKAKSRHLKLCSRKFPEQPLKCMSRWDSDRVKRFAETQYSMIAPIFEFTNEIKHYDLDDNCVPPFSEDYERKTPDGEKGAVEGGYGAVWKVAIHPAHQRVLHRPVLKEKMPMRTASTDTDTPRHIYPYTAIKRLHSTDEQSFKSEVAMLGAFRKHPHSHLVDCLATFRWKGKYHLIFPYAKSNLREYWKATPLPQFSHDTVLWVLRQCKAIVSGLHIVHQYRYTHVPPATGSEEGRIYGRHGDIKAENILWFPGEGTEQGLLVIADFGLTDFHNRSTRSRPANHITGSPSYEPPELILHSRISPAYDIWSLGCVFLELATWLVGGWDALDRFSQVRIMPTLDKVDDDTFFTILGGESLHSPRRAIIRESVQAWIHDIHETPRCSAFVHDLLNMISEQMLVVDHGKRFTIGQLNQDLQKMITRAGKNPAYLIEPRPSKRRIQKSHYLSLTAFSSPAPLEGTPLPTEQNTSESCSSPLIGPQPLANISPPSSPRLF